MSAPTPVTSRRDEFARIVVSDVRMPFWSMVVFMVKWAIASIPAFLILALLTGSVIALSAGFIISAVGLGGPLSEREPRVSSTGAEWLDERRETAEAPASEGEIQAPPPTPDPISQVRAVDMSAVVVRNVQVGESVLGDPGVFGEIKNVGDETLTIVELTIYCLNAQGEPIFDLSYCPVRVTEFGFGDDAEPLKPNYSRKFGVNLEDAPSEWAREVRVEVTEVSAGAR